MPIIAAKGIMLVIKLAGPPDPSPAACCPAISRGRTNLSIGYILKNNIAFYNTKKTSIVQ
jgi:hypothetical protein